MNGFNSTERFVEVPWVFARKGDAVTVLDVGYANAEMEYLQQLANLGIADLHGLDIAAPKHLTVTDAAGLQRPLLAPVQGDMRNTPFEDAKFDLIFCVSTIEHVGFDNQRYAPGQLDVPGPTGDCDAIRELCRITKPGGRLLLTVPFGKYENHGWFQQYDMARLIKLCAASNFGVEQMHFFRYNNGWHECHAYELRDAGYQTNGAPNATGVACIEFRRPQELQRAA